MRSLFASKPSGDSKPSGEMSFHRTAVRSGGEFLRHDPKTMRCRQAQQRDIGEPHRKWIAIPRLQPMITAMTRRNLVRAVGISAGLDALGAGTSAVATETLAQQGAVPPA